MTGPESLSQRDQVSIVGKALGRTLQIEDISPEEAQRELLAIMPAPVIKMLMDAWAAASGQPALVTSTVEQINGTPARTFLDWAVRDRLTGTNRFDRSLQCLVRSEHSVRDPKKVPPRAMML